MMKTAYVHVVKMLSMFDITQPVPSELIVATIIAIVLLTGLGVLFVRYRAKNMIKDSKK